MESHSHFDLHFLRTEHTENSFKCFSAIQDSSVENSLLSSLAQRYWCSLGICLLCQCVQGSSPSFSSVRSSMSGFMLRSLIHLDFGFVQGDRYGSICILLHADIQLNQHHLIEEASFFHCMILASLSKFRCP